METFAERLRHARLLRGLSQESLARACGLSQSAISSYENGTRQSPKKLLSLAQVLEVDIYWLSRGQGSMTPSSGATVSLGESAWPFPSIDPRQFWSLAHKDRLIVERAVGALIDSLLISDEEK
ncbi:MAG: helix-turn-helix transcriptional regulator [Castellaniella sp.]|uniref:helix-turn-helix domain-containing protein n=1 Tax=Castellaniella sp. TaxID=1955812 RepID=UPI002A3591EE|nr:helix-turn-helix transcriptional regulator [Castellaniella sp.]MDY0308549.1 helix-turn-helix transcriptional regulator [Castellaniella sp.]